MPRIERKLTTILAADMVGFSTMMGRDEVGTLAALKACRAIIGASVGEFGGRVFGGAGDSLIAEFTSPLSAVECAIQFQTRLHIRNQGLPANRRIWFRTGINLGDVMIDGANLYGDGINIAARLEQAGEPGGICISYKVYDEVARHLALPVHDGGAQHLKNIRHPVRSFHLRPVPILPAHRASPAATPTPTPTPPNPGTRVAEQQSLFIGRFRVSGGGDAGFLADGLRDALFTGLSKYTALKVVGHDSSTAQFILEGSVRGRGNRVRLSFALIDTTANAHVWSERYDRQNTDVFEVEDEISRAVAATVRVKLKQAAFAGLSETPDADLSPADLLSKAAGIFVAGPGHSDRAEAAVRSALAAEPDNSMALSMLAISIYRAAEFSPLALAAPRQREMLDSADRAVALQPDSYFGHLVAGILAQDITGDFTLAARHGRAALETNADFLPARTLVAIAACHRGDHVEGLGTLMSLIDTAGHEPNRFRHHRELAIAQFIAGDAAAAARTAGRLIAMLPEMDRNKLVLAAMLFHAGDDRAARKIATALRADYPALSVDTMRPQRFADAAAAARFTLAFHAIGLAPDHNVVAYAAS